MASSARRATLGAIDGHVGHPVQQLVQELVIGGAAEHHQVAYPG
jgi:hypothetical protein